MPTFIQYYLYLSYIVTEKRLDTAGRAEKFRARMAKAQEVKPKKKAKKEKDAE